MSDSDLKTLDKITIEKINKFRKNLAYLYRISRLKNSNFTIICNNCCGSFMYQSLGLIKDSPTCDMYISDYHYIDFCRNLKEYLSLPIDDPTEEELKKYPNCKAPIGMLRGKNGLRTIGLIFTHYKTLDDAREKWYRRSARVNYDNLFFILDCGMRGDKKVLDEFEKLPYENKVIFTHLKDYDRWKDTFKFSCFKEGYKQGQHLNDVSSGLFIFKGLDEFDYVRWLNKEAVLRKGKLVKRKHNKGETT